MKTLSPVRNRPVLTALILAFSITTVCHGDPVKAAFTVPAKIDATIDSTCDSSGGSQITISGSVLLRGFKTKMIFKNNPRGKRTANVVTEHPPILVPISGAFRLPKQPSQGGVGPNPYVYVQFRDVQNHVLTDEISLGRCASGLSVSPEVLGQIASSTDVQIEDCSNKKGPNITIGSEVTLSGLSATFILRNNQKGTHTAEMTTDVALVVEGSTVTFPKRRMQGGVGRNPVIGLQLLRDNDEPISDQVTLGRCNKL